MTKIAIILSGSGVFDGSEIHESVLTLLHLDQANIPYQCFAPTRKQHHVINHLKSEETPETRTMIVEAARIARGDIKAIESLNTNEFDAVIFPGGFGAAKNLCDFAIKGKDYTVQEDVHQIINSFHQQEKPMGFICIAPMIAAKSIPNVTVTIGNDQETANVIESVGSTHQICDVTNVIIDQKNKVISTPAYMLATRISQASKGIEKLVQSILTLTKNKVTTR